MINQAKPSRVLLGVNSYTRYSGVEHVSGGNVMQSPQAPAPLPSSIPRVPGPVPNVGSRLLLSGGAYGR